MSMHPWIAFTVMLCVQQSPPALEIPLHPTEARIVEQIIAVEGHTVELAEVPGWAKRGVVNRLTEAGVATEGLRAWGVRDTKMNAVSFNCVTVVHSQVSEAGVKFFEGHASLESFTVAEMGNVSQAALATIAKMPKVEHVDFQEAFVTYEGGLRQLLPMKGRLRTLDLSMSLINAADLSLVKADHPAAKVTTISPAEIVKRHSYVAARISRVATGEAADELRKAIAEFEASRKSSK